MKLTSNKNTKNSSFLAFLSLFMVSEQKKEEVEKRSTKRHFDAWWDF